MSYIKNIDKQQIIIIVVAIILLGGFAVLRYIPLARKTKAIKEARAQYQAGDEQIRTQARKLPIINAKIEKLKLEIGNYESKIPFGRGFATLYDEIAAVMSRHNLSSQSIQPGREIVGKKISSIPMSISCSGRLSDVFEFFRSIESFDRLIRIENIHMQSKLNQSIVDVKAVAIVYYRQQPNGGQGKKI